MRIPLPGSTGERLRMVREATRLRLEDFIDLLNREAVRLYGPTTPSFNPGRVSKLELGVQRASLDDVALFASVDPERRGKLWLGWNELRDSSLGVTDDQLAVRTGGRVLAPLPSPPPMPAHDQVAQRGRRPRTRRAGGEPL